MSDATNVNRSILSVFKLKHSCLVNTMYICAHKGYKLV